MDDARWWHVGVTAIVVVLSALLWVGAESVTAWGVGAQAALLVFAAAWFLVGRRAFLAPRWTIPYLVVMIAAVGVAVSFSPFMAILQCVAYPLVWVLLATRRAAIVANVILATVVGFGYVVATGDPAQAIGTASLSLVFSVALGLWITQIADRSHERQRLLDELRATQDQLAAASRDAGVSSERERLAREIHDTIAQDLTGLVLLAQQAQRELASGDVSATDARLQLIEENAHTALAETRALVAASAPVGLTSGELMDALRRLAERFTRETSIAVTVEGDPGAVDRDQEVVLLRCAQEGLANVRKHSGATAVTLQLSVISGDVRLRVRDNGHGFDDAAPSLGFGLGGMRDRLALVGGFLDVTSSTSGTVLTASLPRNQS
ncbi:signal transduction histidine kinase [Leifsonia sp. AK011]|uniref:sensor histidine kinase n=1 Tax=Leifsonia sp. AK011 TaxID=2723075 RepID=UPI0015C70145|nr:sensor histidine kinase [Leifsonia sp. AK011]NYF08907.1 signal transduction histidine kinase [Leifsonia sp. AK011]